MNILDYSELVAATPADRLSEVNGPSPGGAAAELGITRQAVHRAIKRDALQAYKLSNHGKTVAIIVPSASIENYRQHHLRKSG